MGVQTLVLLPGLMCDAAVWAPLLPSLSAHRHCVVVDHGDSDDLAAKLSTMGDRRVILLDTAGVSQRDIQMLEQSLH